MYVLEFYGIWNGNFDELCSVRLLNVRTDEIMYALKVGWNQDTARVPWAGAGDSWNMYPTQKIPIGENFAMCLTIENTEDDEDLLTQRLYWMEGGKITEHTSYLEKLYYDEFVSSAKNTKYIEIGRCNMDSGMNWCYLKGLCFDIRLYNKGLSSSEVQSELGVLSDLFGV